MLNYVKRRRYVFQTVEFFDSYSVTGRKTRNKGAVH